MPIEQPFRKGQKKKKERTASSDQARGLMIEGYKAMAKENEKFATEGFPLAKEVLADQGLGMLLNLPGKIEISDVTAELEVLEICEQAEWGQENDHSPPE